DVTRLGVGGWWLATRRPPWSDERHHSDQGVGIDGRRILGISGPPELLAEDVADSIGELVHQGRHLTAPLRSRCVAEQHREAVRALLHVGEVCDHGRLESLPRRTSRAGLRDGANDVLDLAVDDHRVEPLLAAEMLVDNGLRDLRPLGDLLDGGRLEAALGKDRSPDLDELGPPGRGVEPRGSNPLSRHLDRILRSRKLRIRKLRRRKELAPCSNSPKIRPGGPGWAFSSTRSPGLSAPRTISDSSILSGAATRHRVAWKRSWTKRATRVR